MFNIIGEKIKQAFNWLASSADNHSNGASGRKLTSIVIVALMIHGHMNWVDHENYYDIHLLDVCFVCVLLGIVTIEQIIKLFAAKSGTVTQETQTTTSHTTTVEEEPK